MKRFGLLPLIAIAIVAGILAGLVAPLWLARIMATFNGIFSNFLGFMIPLIIVGFVTPAIADIGARAGKMLVVTTLLAYGFTLMSGFLSYGCCSSIFPSLLSDTQAGLLDQSDAVQIDPYFTMEMAPLMGVMTALVLSFVMGLGVAFSDKKVLRQAFDEMRDIVARAINVAVIPLLPVYIFGIFLNMTVVGQVASVIDCFIKIVAVIFVLHVGLLLLQYCIAGALTGRNPLSMLRTMLPAYFTALGTQSSAATIPVTLRQTVEMGIDRDTAGFVVPLCATIHLSGSTLKITACALAIMMLGGQPHGWLLFAHFIALLGVTMIAAPGIPGGAIMASIGVLESVLGFDPQAVALMIALYIAMDSFGTACNVTGDGAIAAIVDRIFKKSTVTV